MRVDNTNLDAFKLQAESRGMTQVQYFEQILQDNADGKTLELLKARLESKELEISELQSIISRYEKQTGKKMPKMRSVTFKVTEKEFQDLTNLSHQTQTPKTHLFSKFFTKLHSKKELPKLDLDT